MDITIEKLEHRYQVHSPFERLALYDVNANIKSGSYVAIIGHTGSGKSTILQHLNGLLQPTSGSITIGDRTISSNQKEKNLKSLRKKVGVVFQFPEHQLFEETVEKDICFGPINFGVPAEEAKARAKQVIEMVGLTQEHLTKSPFDLSGGQMRRVAIAGILAMDPEVLVLDEPTAGLDPRGRYEIMEMFYKLHKEKGLTTILVTHSMEDASRYADQILVMEKGTIKLQGSPSEVFSDTSQLIGLGLDVPEVIRLKGLIEKKLGITIPVESSLSIDEIVNYVGSALNIRGEDK
ncbi:energy-coupling factor ABC transporter ATP-binding protein [Fredinandcohnia sp. 179-A 10B2 NHS]|uniref:energy-coupling factor ABC transporter ATP-binding protein n=1 Tax=Fredinandcohnia sp. 179-A 10B2 NHS TaxID=3235176 RepID=UPI0039A1F271